MSQDVRNTFQMIQTQFQRLALVAIVVAAFGLTAFSLAAACGVLPWISVAVEFGTVTLPHAGMTLQLGATGLALALCFFLPANQRILALEHAHRSFHMGMQDVRHAYAAAHAEDRSGPFTLASEFDSVRARIAFLRAHPDLRDLEPGVLELAAQMSHVSRELAQIYSDRNVARARDFLMQRQQDIDTFQDRLAEAKAVAAELKRWQSRIETEEATARSELDWLRGELADILPDLHDAALPQRIGKEKRHPTRAANSDIVDIQDHRASP